MPIICGYGISLEPVEPRHVSDIFSALDDEVTEYLSFTTPKTEVDTAQWVEKANSEMKQKKGVHFMICNKSGQAIGVTSILSLNLDAGTGEVGSWMAARYWGSGYNLAAKHMLLGFAFDELKLKRIRISSFVKNGRSTLAIQKLGLCWEGVVRRDVFVKGILRDRHYFSVLDDEWPSVRQHIEGMLDKVLPLPE